MKMISQTRQLFAKVEKIFPLVKLPSELILLCTNIALILHCSLLRGRCGIDKAKSFVCRGDVL